LEKLKEDKPEGAAKRMKRIWKKVLATRIRDGVERVTGLVEGWEEKMWPLSSRVLEPYILAGRPGPRWSEEIKEVLWSGHQESQWRHAMKELLLTWVDEVNEQGQSRKGGKAL